MPLPVSRLSATACAVLVCGGLAVAPTVGASVPAAPDPDTVACTLRVEADAAVVGALAALEGLAATVPLLEREAAQDQLDEARVAAELRLCTGDDSDDGDGPGTDTPDPTTTTPAPPTSSTPAPDGDSGPRDERDCSDFATRQDAQAFYDRVTTPANPDPSRLDRDGDGVACEADEGVNGSGSGSGSGSIDLDPTDDDDSVADTNGSQVSIVPEGSAATGA